MKTITRWRIVVLIFLVTLTLPFPALAQEGTTDETIMDQLLGFLANPNIVFILLLIGVLGLLIEITTPGGWVSGFIGVICLVLATFGLGILPVNLFGLVFVGTAFVLFLLDIKAPTHGALTIAGTASLIIGTLVLFNSPSTPVEFHVSLWLVLLASVTTAAIFGWFVSFAVKALKTPLRSGREALSIGKTGSAKTSINPIGTVQLGGELWTAQLDDNIDSIQRGDQVELVRLEGNRLVVRKHKSGTPS